MESSAIARSGRGRSGAGTSAWARWRRLPGSLRFGLVLLAAFVLLALVGPLVLVDPNRQDLGASYSGPATAGHPLGTDQLGRDVLSWIASSVFTALRVSVAVVAISAVVGMAAGVVAGYAGGFLDALLMRLVDVNLAVPWIILFIAASAVSDGGMLTLIVLLCVFGWVPYARLVRTRVQVERGRASIAAARLAGARRGRIFVVHLLPRCASTLLVWASLHFGFVMLAETSLSFLGLGVQPPQASLGFMIAEGKQVLGSAWWISVMPGAALALLLLAANLIGDGLQEQFGVDIEKAEVER